MPLIQIVGTRKAPTAAARTYPATVTIAADGTITITPKK